MTETTVQQAPAAPGRFVAWLADQASPSRTILFCGVGAALGLAVAGFGLFTAQGTRTLGVPPEDVAVVNNVPILLADFVDQLRSVYDVSLTQATPEQKQKILGDMVREELYVQRGIELGLASDDTDIRLALVGSAEAAVSQDVMTSRPTDAELRAWYDAHHDSYAGEGQMTVQDFLLPENTRPKEAASIVAALRQDATQGSIKLKSSGRIQDRSEFYFAAKLHLGDALFQTARTLGDGQVSDPVLQPDGLHVLVMRRNQRPLVISYENAQDRVLRDFLAAKVARLQVSNERFLRARADIKLAPELR